MALINSDKIWTQVGHLQRVTITQGQELQPNARNFIHPDATEILWPAPATLEINTIFTIYRGAMLAMPEIVSTGKKLSVLDSNQVYGDAAGDSDCRVPFSKHEETIYIYNGSFIQELPNTTAYDNLTGTLYETTFTSSGSFTVPQSNNLLVTVVGGGGGGAIHSWYGACGGGGGGSIVNHPMTLPVGEIVTITIGSGGSGSNSSVEPTAGGNSSFGAYLIGHGGSGALNYGYTATNIGAGGSFSGSETITTGVNGGDGGTGGYVNHDSNPRTGNNGANGADVTSVIGTFTGGTGGGWNLDGVYTRGGGGGGGASGYANGGIGGNGGSNHHTSRHGTYGSGGGGAGGNGSPGGNGGNGMVMIKWGPKGA